MVIIIIIGTSDKINRHSNDKIVRPFVQDCHNRQLGSRQIIHTHPVCWEPVPIALLGHDRSGLQIQDHNSGWQEREVSNLGHGRTIKVPNNHQCILSRQSGHPSSVRRDWPTKLQRHNQVLDGRSRAVRREGCPAHTRRQQVRSSRPSQSLSVGNQGIHHEQENDLCWMLGQGGRPH